LLPSLSFAINPRCDAASCMPLTHSHIVLCLVPQCLPCPLIWFLVIFIIPSLLLARPSPCITSAACVCVSLPCHLIDLGKKTARSWRAAGDKILPGAKHITRASKWFLVSLSVASSPRTAFKIDAGCLLPAPPNLRRRAPLTPVSAVVACRRDRRERGTDHARGTVCGEEC
jgi:hypothetical protein